MLTTILTATFLLAPAPQDKPPKGKPPVEKSAKKAAAKKSLQKAWTDKEAKAAIKEYKAKTKGKLSVQKALMALEVLKEGRHELLVAPLHKLILKHRKLSVRRAAAEQLGNQPKSKARKAIVALLKNKKVQNEPPLRATLITALGKESYDSRDWKDLGKAFGKLRDNPSKDNAVVEKAIVQLAGKVKEKQALRIIINSMDAPEPKNVDDPSNPPAAYWKLRWENWVVWRADAKESLYQITGQRFGSSKEARTWLRKNGRKLGLR